MILKKIGRRGEWFGSCLDRGARMLLGAALLLFEARGAAGTTRGRVASNELAMELYGGRSIGDVHGLKFLLDAGATTGAIDRKVAGALGLPEAVREAY